jgi:hypothetical protein
VFSAALVLALAAAASIDATPVANPCALVPTAAIAAVMGAGAAASPATTATPTTSTCSYGGLLTIQTGATALTNPTPPLHRIAVIGVPHGVYSTYSTSKQTQIVFYEGTAASGLYIVVRAFAPVKEAKLVRIARLVHASLTGSQRAQTTTTS